MKIELLRLRLTNFKGIRDKEIKFDPTRTRITGRNASGKTTIYDGFMWLLFGKDSNNSCKFDFKPLDEGGEGIKNLETTVEAEIEIDGIAHTIRKMASDLWVNKKMRGEKVYQGDTYAYWIDDVPKSAGDYQDYIDSMNRSGVLEMLTSHPFFMTKLKQADRRGMLVGMIDEDIDAVIAARMPEAFAALEGLPPEDAKAKLRDRKKRYKTEADDIPPAVNELQRLIDEAKEVDVKAIESEIEANASEIARIDASLATDTTEVIRQRLKNVTDQINNQETAAKRKHDQDVREAKSHKSSVEGELSTINSRISFEKNTIQQFAASVEGYDKQLAEKRAKYTQEFNEPFVEPSAIDICPACFQKLPESEIRKVKANYRAIWTEKHEAKLDEITADGKQVAANKENAEQKMADHKAALEKLEAEKTTTEAKLLTAKNEYERIEAEEVEYPEGHDALYTERDKIMAELDAADTGDLTHLKTAKARLEGTNKANQERIATVNAALGHTKRIEEKQARHRELGDQIVDIERRLMLIDQYVSERCNALESSINAHFPTVRWRLFKENKGEGIQDCCDCMIPSGEGAFVPYDSANTGAKINAGLEIITAITRAYNVNAPIFVDNCESINSIRQTDSQMILLVVTDGPLTISE